MPRKPEKAQVVKLNRGDKVQNIRGSVAGPIKPSAKQYWTRATAAQQSKIGWPAQCAVHGCNNKATHGSHVKVYAHSAWGWYLIPACQQHNRGRSNEVRMFGECTMARIRPAHLAPDQLHY